MRTDSDNRTALQNGKGGTPPISLPEVLLRKKNDTLADPIFSDGTERLVVAGRHSLPRTAHPRPADRVPARGKTPLCDMGHQVSGHVEEA